MSRTSRGRRHSRVLVVTALAVVGALAFTSTSSTAATRTTRRNTKKAKLPFPVPSTAPTAAPVPAPPTAAPVAPPAPVAPVSNIQWKVCGAFECAAVQVPMDYEKPAGAKISIALKRTKAKGPKLGSILLNPGGPGGSGIKLLERKPNLVGAASDRYDVIGFDVRGLGDSTNLPCGGAQDRSARSLKQYVSAIKEACDTRAPALRPTITTANTARDMDQIRIALGEPKLNYLGISYGTYLGMVYADLFPDKVGRFIIDSAVDPTVRAIGLQQGQFTQYEQNLLMVLRRCGAGCSFFDANTDTLTRFDKLMKNLEKAPITFSPYRVNDVTVMSLTRNLFEVRGGETLFLKFITELDKGDASSILLVIQLLDNKLPDPEDLLEGVDSDAVYSQVACNEGFHPSASVDFPDYARLVTQFAPRFKRLADAQAGSPWCAYWDAAKETRPIPVAKPGVPPMLFVASRYDRVTPMVWTEAAASKWPGSVVLRVTSFEHGAVPDEPCATAAAANFYLTGGMPAANACP